MQQQTLAPATGVALCLHNVHRAFPPGIVAVDRVDLQIPAGQFIAILGPSGCGKSTLLRLIANLDRPDRGDIQLSAPTNPHISTDPPRPATAYVFQDAHLLPWRNVLRNVALPLELLGIPREQRLADAAHALQQVGLADAITQYPAQLSGGMRMRVSLARALVTNPQLLLLDEPFAALDEITRYRLDEQLRQLWLRRGMTVIFVTHSTSEAVFLADRAVVLSARPARIVADHPIDLPSERTADLRSDPAFARHTRILYQALQHGGA